MKQADVYGVGNALVDTLAFVDDNFLREHNLTPGSMTLVDAEKQANILHALSGKKLELRSGGSAANTMIAIARSGGSAFYTSKVSKDTNGEFYRQDLLDAGIHFDVNPATEKEGPTGTCVVITTPDAERTMLTHLGVSIMLTAKDVNPERIKSASMVYVEGYLWAGDGTRAACIEAGKVAKSHNVPLAFTFSDSFLVAPFRSDFFGYLKDYCSVAFCNASEATAFAEMDDLLAAAAYIGQICPLVFVTNSENGAIVVENQVITEVPGFPVKPVDTNGAGDAFAGGALFALTHGYSTEQAAKWGNYLASQIVQIAGARLTKDYSSEFKSIVGG